MNRKLISKHLSPNTATATGHMTRTRKGLRSTRIDENEDDARATEEAMVLDKQACTAEDDEIFCYSITTDNDGNIIYSDLVGPFSIES